MREPSVTQPLTSHSGRVLLALAVGLIAGSLIAANPTPLLRSIVTWIEPVGTMWINALRMVGVPLVVSMLIAGVASIADAGTVRRIGGITFGVWIRMLLVSGLLGLTLVPLLFSGLTIDPAATAALRESASSLSDGTTAGLERMPTLQQWLTDLIPTNPVRAAADGAMLPLVIFSLAFGLAVTRIRADRRETLLRVFDGAAETMLVIVR